ncbi:uncharacterized protein AB675_1956 [Cyphellophora attinorum]|uniref:F-box domain-containing protein n=1 Tax=Cyphellophora attinorum TaxID=1664694 RepID=A0A0N1HDZ6_9EURO|nr:uncharacterized protein AB675_1956 [Phialophora attinorum]KPI43037.1 hypothetical protein AB675_1956 [Phialophora attinorum]
MPGLESLEVELLSWIFELIDDTSPATLRSLALVNKYFNATTKLVAHRHKTLNYTPLNWKNDATEVQQWLQSEDILRGLRYLTVENVYTSDSDENPEVKWRELALLIEKLGNVKLLVWNHGSMIPLPILNALHTHQKKAELQIYKFERNEQTADEHDPAELALAASPALTAIKASFQNNGDHPDLRDACFKRIVAQAPNLRFASLSRYSAGCVIHGISQDQWEEKRKLEEKFYVHQSPNGSLRRLTLDGYGMSGAILDHWARFVDLTKLDNIKCSSGRPEISYFERAPVLLTGLKDVSLNFSYGMDGSAIHAAVENYLSTTAPLRSLSLWSWMGKLSLSSVLARHGDSLEVLQLHERESASELSSDRRKVLTADDVKSIRLSCPKLRDLTIDCDRPSELLDTEIESDAVLKELKEMETLSRLQIYYDLGLSHIAHSRARPVPDPRSAADNDSSSDDDADREDSEGEDEEADEIDDDEDPPGRVNLGLPPSSAESIKAYVSELWKFIFGHRSNPGVLEVKVGEWERKIGGGYPVQWVLQEASMRTRWIVKADERDDRKGQCTVTQFGGEGLARQPWSGATPGLRAFGPGTLFG